MVLPGHIPGYSRTDIQLLPSSVSKRAIWQTFQASASIHPTAQAVAYSTFGKLWRKLVPIIVTMKPMSDLCWTCQQNNTLVLRSANRDEGEKEQGLADALEHLRIVNMERTFYSDTLAECKSAVFSKFSQDGTLQLPPAPRAPRAPLSTSTPVHYSFDYAQQVYFPSNPLQPGPIYFLTCRKCSIFGVCCESIPRQVNFLTDEAADGGKRANAVISMLHYFFEHYGLGENEAYLHANNYVGQNKNNAVMQYMMWRIMTGRHKRIRLSFLVVGHTKFSPDWCFRLFKRLYRRTNITCLNDIKDTVEKSAVCNTVQLVAEQDGTINVPTYNWLGFLSPHFKSIPGIKSYQHFEFTCESPGDLLLRKNADTPPQTLRILKACWDAQGRPDIVPPKGLSLERQLFLYHQIRPFCPDDTKDIVCPEPSLPPRTSGRSVSNGGDRAKRSRVNYEEGGEEQLEQ